MSSFIISTLSIISKDSSDLSNWHIHTWDNWSKQSHSSPSAIILTSEISFLLDSDIIALKQLVSFYQKKTINQKTFVVILTKHNYSL